MVQSSLTAWLKGPAAVTRPSEQKKHVDEENAHTKPHARLPTPPPSSGDEASVDATFPEPPREVTAIHPKSAFAPKRPTLPPNVQLRPCTKSDIQAFKRLNSLLLPVPYPDSFYRDTLQDPVISDLTLLACWHDEPDSVPASGDGGGRLVGAIRCRLLTRLPGCSPTAQEKPILYLSTLVLLSPFRGRGIAAEMLRLLTVRAVEAHGIGSIGAHVWSENAEGLEWYARRGFAEIGREEGYYRRLRPTTAVVVLRQVRVEDLLARGDVGG